MGKEEVQDLILSVDIKGIGWSMLKLRTMDKFINQVYERSKKLDRLQVRPVFGLIDRITGPAGQIADNLKNLFANPYEALVQVKYLDPGMPKAGGEVSKSPESGSKSEENIFDGKFWAETVRDFLVNITSDFISNKLNRNKGTNSSSPIMGTQNCMPICPNTGSSSTNERRSRSRKTRVSRTKETISRTTDRTKETVSRTTDRTRNTINQTSNKTMQSTTGRRSYQDSPGDSIRKPMSPSQPGTNTNPSTPGKIIRRSGTNNFISGSSGSIPDMFDSKPSKITGTLSKVGKVASKLFRPLSIGMDIMNITSAKPGEERNKAIGGAAGGWAGAATGAAAGAAIGSVVPVIGTAIGGLIGGIAGGLGGDWLGSTIGGWFSKKTDKPKPEIPPQKQLPSVNPSLNLGNNVSGYLGEAAGVLPQITARNPNSGIEVNLSGTTNINVKVEELVDENALAMRIGSVFVTQINNSLNNRNKYLAY